MLEGKVDGMKYILQLCTGSLHASALSPGDAIDKLEYAIEKLGTEKVIFGWNEDTDLNIRICKFLKKKGIEVYFWLPVFAEIQDETIPANRKITVGKDKKLNLFGNDSFEFSCQSSYKSISAAIRVFEKVTAGLQVDGVFLDRIRYGSAAAGWQALFGCWCQRCCEEYRKNGVDTEAALQAAYTADIRWFTPAAREKNIYRYASGNADLLMSAKRNIISRQVETLCTYFRDRGFKIGADTFAPSTADFVGQDLNRLGKMVDFIKPMLYGRTNAPAGLPYELDALGDHIQEALSKCWNGSVYDMNTSVQQIQELVRDGICVTPGIDANYIDGICQADVSYVAEMVSRMEEAQCREVVLSWDLMHLGKDVIDWLGGRQ